MVDVGRLEHVGDALRLLKADRGEFGVGCSLPLFHHLANRATVTDDEEIHPAEATAERDDGPPAYPPGVLTSAEHRPVQR